MNISYRYKCFSVQLSVCLKDHLCLLLSYFNHSGDTVAAVEDQWMIIFLGAVKLNTGTILPPNGLPLLFLSDHARIPCGELMHARSQCYLSDLGF